MQEALLERRSERMPAALALSEISQPVEHLAALRCIPGLLVVRPGDANEVAEGWRLALQHRDGPVALVLTRQKLPCPDRAALAPATGVHV